MIHSYHGALYACVVGGVEKVQGKMVPTETICRVHPESADPLEAVRTVPQGFGASMFSGRSLYLSRTEKQRSLWANLINDDAGASYKNALYRIAFSR